MRLRAGRVCVQPRAGRVSTEEGALLVTSTNFLTVLPSAVAADTRLSVPLWSTCAGLSFLKLRLGVKPVAHTTAVTPDMAAAMESGSDSKGRSSPRKSVRICIFIRSEYIERRSTDEVTKVYTWCYTRVFLRTWCCARGSYILSSEGGGRAG